MSAAFCTNVEVLGSRSYCGTIRSLIVMMTPVPPELVDAGVNNTESCMEAMVQSCSVGSIGEPPDRNAELLCLVGEVG